VAAPAVKARLPAQDGGAGSSCGSRSGGSSSSGSGGYHRRYTRDQ